jgi:hypothetical protein
VTEALRGRVDGDVLELEGVTRRPDHKDADDASVRVADPDVACGDERLVVRSHGRGRTADARHIPRVGRLDHRSDCGHVTVGRLTNAHVGAVPGRRRPGTACS